MAMALDLGPEVFLNQSIALRDRPDQKETLRAYAGPSLVLCGRHDALCPVERHELMHDLLANAQLTIIEDAGHMPTLEQPEETTAALVRWLASTQHHGQNCRSSCHLGQTRPRCRARNPLALREDLR